MRKKGQVYIIAAILLSVVIFALASVTNIAKQEKFKGDFEKLSRNYETEGSKLINTVVSTEGDKVGEKFGKFTYDFTAYSKTQNSQFGLIYVLDYGGRVYIGNYLKGEIYVDDGSGMPFKLLGCFEEVPASISFGTLGANFDIKSSPLKECVKDIPEPSENKTIYIAVNNSWYPFELTPGKPQMMVVSKMEQQEQVKVFIGGEGFLKKENHCKDLGRDLCRELEEYDICEWDEDRGRCKQETGKSDKSHYVAH